MNQIFRPLRDCKGKDVIITTWNIAHPDYIPNIINHLKSARYVALYVGYSKVTHNLEQLLKTMLIYASFHNWYVFGAPNMHAKFWMIGDDLYVGSANLCANTLANIMVKTDDLKAHALLDKIIQKSKQINDTTDLKLLPQVYKSSDLISF